MTQGAANPYLQVIESLSSGVLAVDDDGIILIANPAACGQLHVPPTRLRVGERLVTDNGLEPLGEVLREIAEGDAPITRRELHITTADGERKVIGLSASPLGGEVERKGTILLFVDLTEVRRLEHIASLNRQLAEVGELTAGVVHELRNPLSVIAGMAELLVRRLEEGGRDHATAVRIVQEAGNLERVIRQFLGFARPFDLEPTACNVREIVDRALQLTQPAAQAKAANVRVACPDQLPAFRGDPVKLSQALANIIGNAIDVLQPNGEVRVSAVVDGAVMAFIVEDNGPGLKLQPGEDPFAPFFSRKTGGTGLGLAIVQRIIAAHNGTASFANRDEGGARFELRIPL
ncbi:MAG TPA: ATP-binding protein [Candidatus Hydrogenedentes bacterium]|nr:ATP-binding protein [Candidatus Hydrogenedentota bacterium]HNT87726.1 ATP-binding protein [Candidatus Hydrogenedentota bacterium]